MSAIPPYNPGGAPGISADRLNQPFHVKAAQYDAPNDRIRVTIGAGRADFGGGAVFERVADGTYDIPAPAANTTYHVYVTANGFTHDTAGRIAAGARLATLAVGGVLADPAITDVRGMIPVPIPATSPFLLMGA